MNKPIDHYRLNISSEIFHTFPDYAALVIYAEGLTNLQSTEYSIQNLREAERHARERFLVSALESDPHITAWRNTFRGFGAKPKKYLCGAEALLSRVLEGEQIPPINEIVDLYNAISLEYSIPIGGEDWSGITSDLTLIKSDGSEEFATMTSSGERIDFPSPGEIIWADSSGATVRRWNWRQCFRTRITPNTSSAYFVLDRLEPLPITTLYEAGRKLEEHLKVVSPSCQISQVILHNKYSDD